MRRVTRSYRHDSDVSSANALALVMHLRGSPILESDARRDARATRYVALRRGL